MAMFMIGHKRGDTMIEVLFAVTIFAVVAIAGLTIMNQGAASAQRSLELSLVRHEMDAQAEALRALYDERIEGLMKGKEAPDAWKKITTTGTEGLAKTTASTFPSAALDESGQCRPPSEAATEGASNSRAFVINTNTMQPMSVQGRSGKAAVSSRVVTSPALRAEGMWIEAERHTDKDGNLAGYTDFHIRACWETVGQSQPVTLGTIVRLYEPEI